MDTTQTLPEAPPKACLSKCGDCDLCDALPKWKLKFNSVVDDILAKSYIHHYPTNWDKGGSQNKSCQYFHRCYSTKSF